MQGRNTDVNIRGAQVDRSLTDAGGGERRSQPGGQGQVVGKPASGVWEHATPVKLLKI